MNFLDAHKIVHDYGESLGKGTPHPKYSLLYRPQSNYPDAFDKDKIVSAYMIFYAHMILYNTRTQQQYEQYDTALTCINHFVPDSRYYEIVETVKIAMSKGIARSLHGKTKVMLAEKEMQRIFEEMTSIGAYRKEEVEKLFEVMQVEKKKLLFALKKAKENNDEFDCQKIMNKYIEVAYRLAGTPYTDYDYHFFFPFEKLRENLKNSQSSFVYAGYEDYIRNFQ